MANGYRLKQSAASSTLLNVVIVVAVLYFARTVLIPLALAILLTFLLAPLATRMRRWGIVRVFSTIIVVLIAFLVLGVLGAAMAYQSAELARKMPEYQENIDKKMESIRTSGGSIINRATRLMHNFSEELTPPLEQPSSNRKGDKPVPVEVHRMPFSPLEFIRTVLGSLVNILVTAGIVIVFVIFMLLQHEDLRDRLIRLGGAGRARVTARVLNDAGNRVSRYLVAQLVINVTYGVLAGLGLYFIGVPNPLLWALVAALLRYIPYLGIWIAAVMPAALALAVEPGFAKALIILGMYIGIDLLMYNFLEPLLYGNSTGVSPLAILVAAVFWTWLWGAVGLLLATPLTVCVVVIGRHVPSLEFLGVMLSDKPELEPDRQFYKSLLAMDFDEAARIAEEFLQTKPLEELFDAVIVPALSAIEEDRHAGLLGDAPQKPIFVNLRLLIEDLAGRGLESAERDDSAKALLTEREAPRPENVLPLSAGRVVCVPTDDEADEIAAFMLVFLLRQRGIAAQMLWLASAGEKEGNRSEREKPQVACVVAVPPFGYMPARLVCRRLREQFPELKVITAILAECEEENIKQRRPIMPADKLTCSLKQTVTEVISSVRTEGQNPDQLDLASSA